MSAPSDELIVTAPNGVGWRRLPGKTCTATEFLTALDAFCADWITQQWNQWQEGQPERERERLHDVIAQWEHAEPPPGGGPTVKELEAEFAAKRAEREREREARAAAYDHDRAMARLELLRRQADAGFMRHVLTKPATDAQRDKASQFLAEAEQKITSLESQVGDPDSVTDELGYLPPERRSGHLRSHMSDFRHRCLREWSGKQKRRFRQLLAMPVPEISDMCSECQAPADWHTYAISLRLYLPQPEPGSQAETLARLMPGWWERCPASTTIQIHQWWGDGLPDFDGPQWQAMLTPLLRAVFAPEPATPRKKPDKQDKRAALEQQLRNAESKADRIRRELSELGPGDA